MPRCSFYASTSFPSSKAPSITVVPLPTIATAAAVATTTTAAAALSLHMPELPSHVRDKILSLELMGMDYRRALMLNPALRNASPKAIHAVVLFLQSRGLHFKDLSHVLGMCPSVLTASVRADLLPVFSFLSDDLGSAQRPGVRPPPRRGQVPARARLQRARPVPPRAHLPPAPRLPGQRRAGAPGPDPPGLQRGADHDAQAAAPGGAGHVLVLGGGEPFLFPSRRMLCFAGRRKARRREPSGAGGRRVPKTLEDPQRIKRPEAPPKTCFVASEAQEEPHGETLSGGSQESPKTFEGLRRLGGRIRAEKAFEGKIVYSGPGFEGQRAFVPSA